MRKVSIPLILCFALFSGSKVHAQFAATPRIRNNIIHTYAGGGPDGVPALSANIPVPTAVATDFAGNIYIAAPWGDRIFVVDTAGKMRDRKSTRLNSSHLVISYAVFCLKKK